MELLNMVKLGTMGFKPADIKQLNASGIESEQIIELAKAGYQVTDVNELIKLAQEEPKPKPEEKPAAEPEKPAEPAGAKDELDDKQKLEDAMKQLEEQKAIISKLQEKNAQKDLGQPNTETPESIFRNALREVY
jgi:DNA-binding transcriptional MerR regulator